MKKILFISGARPNLIKLAPLYKYFKNKKKFKVKILHTNQHSNKHLFKNICSDLNIGVPNFIIDKIKSNTNINMISYFINKISEVLDQFNPNYVILFGDVDTTLSGAIAAVKKNFPIFHIEAGLRSKDFRMQEEINRRLVDRISDLNFCTTLESLQNLKNENQNTKSHHVGNIIFDNYFDLKNKINESKILKKLSVKKDDYILFTAHRYQIINSKLNLKKLCALINKFSTYYKVVFVCHSRTKMNLKKNKLLNTFDKNVILTNPLNYTDFTKLLIFSKIVVTDSGGVHEEAYFHKKKCLILRDQIEREEFLNQSLIKKINFVNAELKLKRILKVKKYRLRLKNKWDGRVSQRIFKIIENYVNNN